MGAIGAALRPKVVALAAAGHRVGEIAEAVGCHHSTISKTLALPEVQDEIAAFTSASLAGLRAATTSAAADALKVMRELAVDTKVPAIVRQKAAADLLDRAGVVRGQHLTLESHDRRVAADSLISREEARGMSIEQLNAVLQRIDDSRRALDVIDAEDGADADDDNDDTEDAP